MVSIEKRVDGLRAEYAKNVDRNVYDLLEKLMIESLFAYVDDGGIPAAARESYIAKLSALVSHGKEGRAAHVPTVAAKTRTSPMF